MKTFLSLAYKQIRIGTSIVLIEGVLLGLFLGILLVSLENAPLFFKNTSARIYAVVFLTSLCALISIVLFFPLELIVACGSKAWSSLSKMNVKRFYIFSFAIGVVFIHAFLSLGFNFVRDLRSPKGIVLSLGLLLTALVLLLTLVRLRPKSIPHEDAIPRAWFLTSLIAIILGLGIISFQKLSSSLKHVTGTTNVAIPQVPQAPTLIHGPSTGWSVILISIDTLRSDHLSCYGYRRRTSTNIDRLAEDGVIFLNARSQAPWTLPSHASMLTSLYPSSHGVRFYSSSSFNFLSVAVDTLSESNLTLAEILQAIGFRTGAFTSMDWLSPMFGFDQGFDRFEMDAQSHTATTVVDKAIDWVGDEKTHPFFLFLHLFEVHQYAPPAKYDRYQDADYRGKLKDKPMMHKKIIGNLYEELSDADIRYIMAKYDGTINYVDSELGRFFEWLRKTDRYNNTLIIVTADHGEEFWDHGGTGHAFSLYDELLRVPLIIKPPGTKHSQRHRVSGANVGVIDIMPTVLDYLGLPQLSFFEGVTLRPFIEGKAQQSPRTLFAEDTFFFNSYAIIQNDFKYIDNRIPPMDPLNFSLLFANIRSFYKFRSNELYRVDRDPDETLNLSKIEPDITSRMQVDLLEHIQNTKARQQMEIDNKTVEQLRSLGYIK